MGDTLPEADPFTHYKRRGTIKLHGDYLFDDIKNTPKETHSLEDNMRQKLCEFLKEYGLLIAGYSGSDRSITRLLEELCDNDIYLRNGLYWCFRDTDDIAEEAVEILEKTNCFYVLAPGFDELMADLYSTFCQDSTPFNSKLASDRASNIINTYLHNNDLKCTTSVIIRKHLEALEADKNASLVSSLVNDLNAENMASAGLTDRDFLVYLEIQRALKDGHPELVLSKLADELAQTLDRRFKEILLYQRFLCSVRLCRYYDAQEAARQVLALDEANFYMALNECSLLERRGDRILYLERLKAQHPFSAPVLNAYAEEVSDAMEKPEGKRLEYKPESVLSTLERSLKIQPSLKNEAWQMLFKFHSRRHFGNGPCKELNEIIEAHLDRNPFHSRTTSMLLKYCKRMESPFYKEKSVFDYLQEAYRQHFPRDYSAQLTVFIDACIEFDAHRLLRPILEDARTKQELDGDGDFVQAMMDVYYDVFRDLSGAIVYGRDFLRTHKDHGVETKLVDFYVSNHAPTKAREFHLKLKGVMSVGQWLFFEAKIAEAEGRFQDAVDAIESIPDRRDFDEKYTSHLSYLELKMGLPDRAAKRCRDFLDKRSFATSFEAEIINYEYAKTLIKKNVEKKRVGEVSKHSQSKMVKAVCHSLLHEDQQAIEMIRKQAEKRFSEIDRCLPWPVLSRHENDLRGIREELLKGKRSLTDLPQNTSAG